MDASVTGLSDVAAVSRVASLWPTTFGGSAWPSQGLSSSSERPEATVDALADGRTARASSEIRAVECSASPREASRPRVAGTKAFTAKRTIPTRYDAGSGGGSGSVATKWPR